MKLDPWQEEALAHEGHLLLCTGRQVGKTYIYSRKAAEYMINNPNSRIVVASLTEDQAKLIISMALFYLEQNFKRLIAKGKNKATLNKIVLTNKSQMFARPVGQTGNAIRGFTGDVLILDEVSRMPEPILTAAKPILLTTGGKIWMCSTPFGKQGYFWESFQNKRGRFKVIQISSEDVIKNREICESWSAERRVEGLKLLEDEKAEMTKLGYAQEYLGEFLDELRQFFSDDLIKKCQILQRRKHIITYKDYVYGCDVARVGKDEFTHEILDVTNKNYIEHVENIMTKGIPLTESARRIMHLNSQYDFIKEYVDSGGMGIAVCDILREDDDNKSKVVEINNASRGIGLYNKKRDKEKTHRILKEDLYANLKILMELNKIKLLDDDEVFQSLKSIQAEHEEGGKLKIWGNYSHITEGLIRAAWHVKSKHLKDFIYGI